MTEASAALSQLIGSQIMHHELVRLKALPTAADRKAVRTEIETNVGGAAKLAKFDKQFIKSAIDSRVLTVAWQRYLAKQKDKKAVTLTPAQRQARMRELYKQAKPTQPLCLNAIQTATEPEATAARTRVDGGEAFGAVAKSLAPAGVTVADDGFAACLAFADAQTAFGKDLSKAKVGDIIGPLPYTSQQGAQPIYLVLQVAGLDGPTYEQILPQLEQAVPVKAPATDPKSIDVVAPLAKLTAKAHVTVNPMYGKWHPKTGQVVPPKVPTEPTTTTRPKKTTTTRAVVPTTGS